VARGPKQKSHRGAAKRFRVTGSGKFKHRHAFRSHHAWAKNAKRGRALRREGLSDERDTARLERLLPYRK
jgi:large subunit ribosomal protein L35